MDRLVVPVEDEVAGLHHAVAEDLLVGGDDETDVALAVLGAHVEDEVAEGHADGLLAKGEGHVGVAAAVGEGRGAEGTVGGPVSGAVAHCLEVCENGTREGRMEARQGSARIKHNVRVSRTEVVRLDGLVGKSHAHGGKGSCETGAVS